MKIVLIGAGSREFGPATVRDILLSDAVCAAEPTVVLMDVADIGLPRIRRYARDLAKRLGRAVTFETTTSLEKALAGADVVVMAIEVRRYFYWAQDFHVPRQHGFRQIYGENGGPGGLFHALRNMGPSVDVARKVAELCPDAWLLNYTNPLTKLCEAQTRLSDAKVIGLCHGVFHGKEQLCRLLEIEMSELEAYACGLNHFTWFETVQRRDSGEDLYPNLRERERDAHWLADWDEIALSRVLLRTFGLYPSPGANHIGEYLRWAGDFLGSQALQFFYDPRDGQPWETGMPGTWIYNLNDRPTEVPTFPPGPVETLKPKAERHSLDAGGPVEPSGELAIPIIEGLFCGQQHELAAVNVPNRGFIPNLPDGAVVEVPARVDTDGIHPRTMLPLPEAIAALLRTQVSINRVLVDAYQQHSRALLLQALLLDPTAESYANAVNLINRMCELQVDVLPDLRW